MSSKSFTSPLILARLMSYLLSGVGTHGYHVKIYQGAVKNVVDVKQWPAPDQALTVAFIAGSTTEGHSNGIAASLPDCYGSRKLPNRPIIDPELA